MSGSSVNPAYEYEDVVRQDVLRMVPDDGKVIGSIGCGWAATEAVLVQQGREVHGVDIAPHAVEKASQRLTSARLVRPDQVDLYAPASLDGLILADVIEHLPAGWDALRTFAGFVRPGGWVVISVPNMRTMEVFRDFIWGGDWPEKAMGIFDQTHLQVMTRKRLLRWCDHSGLDLDQWFDRYLPKYPRKAPFFDRATLGVFHEWLIYQLQGRWRKRAAGAPARPVAGAT